MDMRDELIFIKKVLEHGAAFICGVILSIIVGIAYSINCGIQGMEYVSNELRENFSDDDDEDEDY